MACKGAVILFLKYHKFLKHTLIHKLSEWRLYSKRQRLNKLKLVSSRKIKDGRKAKTHLKA